MRKTSSSESSFGRVVISFAALIVALGCFGCTPSSPPPTGAPSGPTKTPLSQKSDHELRNLAKVHAERDSEEGYLDATAALRVVVGRNPRSVDDLLNLARTILLSTASTEENFDEALAFLRTAASALDPADARSRAVVDYLSALCLKRLAKDADAIVAIRRAAIERPDVPQVLYQHGLIAENLDLGDEALTAYGKLLELAPNFRAAAYRSAQIYQKRGDRAAAEKMLALWKSIPEDKSIETEICELTRVRRVPLARAGSEPKEPTLTWTRVTDRYSQWLALTGVTGVLPDRDPKGDGDALWIVGEFGARRGRTDGSLDSFETGPIDAAPTLGDLRNDGASELIVRVGERWEARAIPAGRTLPLPAEIVAHSGFDARVVDADHDGDLDVAVATPQGVVIAENDGNDGFAVRSPFTESGPIGVGAKFDFHDFDQGSDVDFAIPRAEGALVAQLNLRTSFRSVELGGFDGVSVVRVEDLNNDRAPDVIAATGSKVVYAFNADRDGIRGGMRLRPTRTVQPPVGAIRDLRLTDIDLDGDVDLLVAGLRGVALLRNRRGGEFEIDGMLPFQYGAREVTTADLDGDGRDEVIALTVEGSIEIVDAVGAPNYASLTLLPEGGRDNRDGIGAVVEVYTDDRFSARMAKEPTGVRIGLGAEDDAALDGVFIRWPQGIRQSAPGEGLAENGRATVVQREGLMASCPFLYVRGRDGWSFRTDAIAIAPLAEWLPPGATPHRDPEEYVYLPGSELAVIDGRVEIAITEELRETTYIDRAELVWVDYPGQAEVVADESTRQGAYDPLAFWLYDRERRFSPADAVQVTSEEADQRNLVLAIDGEYSRAYATDVPTQWAGWVHPHQTTFELDRSAQLILLTGRIAWYDSTVVYALAQQGRGWSPLELGLAAEGEGEAWETVIPDLGVPAGMDRTMVIERDRPFDPGRYRLLGHHRFSWDRIAFVERADRVEIDGASSGRLGFPTGEVRYGRVPAATARLEFHGYSEIVGDLALHDQTYRYEMAEPSDQFPRARGMATRYGDVHELVTAHDDHVVVMVAGDRTVLSFDVPEPKEGVGRAYFLRLTGWCKEGSFHNVTGDRIDPLPYRAMTEYPPREPRPLDAAYRKYMRKYQTRVVR